MNGTLIMNEHTIENHYIIRYSHIVPISNTFQHHKEEAIKVAQNNILKSALSPKCIFIKVDPSPD